MVERIETDGLFETFEAVGGQFLSGIFILLIDGVDLCEVVESEIVEQRVIHFFWL